MPAIITSKFRLDSTEAFIDSLQGTTNKHYVGIGRAHAWTVDTTPTTPYENDDTNATASENMYAAKKIETIDSIYATPRHLWVSGMTVVEYDDQDEDLESKVYYVISDNNNVYLCLKAGTTSTRNPDLGGVTTTGVIDFTSNDGFIWKYLFTVPVDTASKFLTSSFIPVHHIKTQPAVGSDAALLNQDEVQDNAVAGAIYNIKVTGTGGSGYTTVPTVTIVGNGSSATATAVLTSQVLTGITVTNVGSGYDNAVVTISGGGGTGGTARAVLSPKGGFGADARHDLRAHYVAINKVFNGSESDAIASANDFRQISVIRNPVDQSTSATAVASIYNTAHKLTITGASGDYSADDEISSISGDSKGIVVEYTLDAANASNGLAYIYFVQTPSTGFGTFDTTENVRLSSDSSGSGNDITTVTPPGLNKYTGDLLFLENRTPVTRGSDQIETIRLVIAF